MTYVIASYWGWLLGAFIIGALIGWFTRFKSGAEWIRYAVWLSAAVILLGFAIAVLRLLPDRPGSMLAFTLLLLVLCGLGCLCAWALRNGVAAHVAGSSRPRGADDDAGSMAGSPLSASDADQPSPSVAGAADIAAVQIRPDEPQAAPTQAAPAHDDIGLSRPDIMNATESQALSAVDSPAETSRSVSAAPTAVPVTPAAPVAATVPPDVAIAGAPLTMETTSTGRLTASLRAAASAAPIGSQSDSTPQMPKASDTGSAPQSIPVPPAPAAPGDVPPQPALAVPDESRHPGRRPEGYLAPRNNAADDLKRIKGIGKQNEARLHSLGIWHFDQIAAWTSDNTKWIGSYLAFAGRIEREKWIEQARSLASGVATAVPQRAADKAAASTNDAARVQSDTQRVNRRRR